MKTYWHNSNQVTKSEWKRLYHSQKDGKVILRTHKQSPLFEPPKCENVVSVETVRKMRRVVNNIKQL